MATLQWADLRNQAQLRTASARAVLGHSKFNWHFDVKDVDSPFFIKVASQSLHAMNHYHGMALTEEGHQPFTIGTLRILTGSITLTDSNTPQVIETFFHS